MIASFVTSLVAFSVIAPRYAAGDPRADSMVLLVTVAVTTAVWITVTLVTRPETDATLDRFYRRVRPGGPGWAQVSTRLGFGREPIPGGALQWTNWIAGVVAVYATLFGIGKVIFGDLVPGLITLAIAAGAFAWIARAFRSEDAEATLMRRGDGTEGSAGSAPAILEGKPAVR